MSSDGETWIQTQWRPLLAISYMIIILFDFVVGPILWTTAQAVFAGQVTLPWVPLTLDGGGVFHAGMAAILGVAAFTRGSEKLAQLQSQMNEKIISSDRG